MKRSVVTICSLGFRMGVNCYDLLHRPRSFGPYGVEVAKYSVEMDVDGCDGDSNYSRMSVGTSSVLTSPDRSRAVPTPDNNPISPELQRTLDSVQQTMREYDALTAPIRNMIDDGVLADVQRITAALEPVLAQAKAAADAVYTPELRLMFEQINAKHSVLFAKLEHAFPMNPLIPKGAVMGILAVEHDTAMPGKVSTTASAPGRPRSKITPQQQLALLLMLAGLHGYAMDLRRADLADAGTGAIIMALLLVMLALQIGEVEK